MLFENLTNFLITQEWSGFYILQSCYRCSHVIDHQKLKNLALSMQVFPNSSSSLYIPSWDLFITWAASAELIPVPKVLYTLVLPAHSISPWFLVLCYQYSLNQSWHRIKLILIHLTTFNISFRVCPVSESNGKSFHWSLV